MPKDQHRTNTVIGTPHYMAPEVIEGKGYSFSVDYWSIGICLYQLVYNKYPFGEKASDVVEIYKSIRKNNLKFLNYYKYSFEDSNNINLNDVNNVILGLLEKEKSERMLQRPLKGVGVGTARVKTTGMRLVP